jgi:outer membrane murein-binding lipoprotein Lpp
MKSWTNTVLAAALLSTLSLAGCGTNEKSSEIVNQPSSKTAETKEHKDAAKPAVQSSESNQENKEQNTASSENKPKAQESVKSNDSTNSQTGKSASTGNSVQSKDSIQSTDSVQSKNNVPSQGSVQSKNVRPFEKKIQYSVGGQTKSDTAVLEESENQGFSMYVLPHYELTAEEPYKDIVYLKDKDQLFMRIELMQKTQNWNTFKQSAFDQLKAINDQVEPITPPNTSTFKNATAYRTITNDAMVTAYVIPSNTHPIKVTIFDDKNGSHSDAFLKMADTIQVK